MNRREVHVEEVRTIHDGSRWGTHYHLFVDTDELGEVSAEEVEEILDKELNPPKENHFLTYLILLVIFIQVLGLAYILFWM